MSQDDDAKAKTAQVMAIMDGGQDKINEYLIRGMMNLQENGCAQRCRENAKKTKVRPHITTAFISTAVVGIVEGVLAAMKSKGLIH